jgi:hypothetical protein
MMALSGYGTYASLKNIQVKSHWAPINRLLLTAKLPPLTPLTFEIFYKSLLFYLIMGFAGGVLP